LPSRPRAVEVAEEDIAAVVAMMRGLGLESCDFSIRISSRQLLEEAFLASGVSQESLAGIYAILDKRHKIGEVAFTAELKQECGTDDLITKVLAILNVSTIDGFDSIAPDLGSVDTLKKLFSPNIQKALTFLDDSLLPADLVGATRNVARWFDSPVGAGA